MSRSRRYPLYTDGYRGSNRRQFFKKYANKLLRKIVELPAGSYFKKITRQTYNICDFKFLPRDEADKQKASRK